MLRIKMWFPPYLSRDSLEKLKEEVKQAVHAMPELCLSGQTDASPILVPGSCGVYVQAYCTLHCPRPQKALIRERLAAGLGRAVANNMPRATPIWVYVYSSVLGQEARWKSKPASW